MKKLISQLSPIFLVASQLSFGATFTVTHTEDKGPGSLRQAILEANLTKEADTIEFKIPGPGPYTISPASALPSITAPVTIDGTTQSGFAGQPIIELDGSALTAQPAVGLRLVAGKCTVRGLVINGFQSSFESARIYITSGSSGNVIQGNFIGTDVSGEMARPNSNGLWVTDTTSNNLIGGTTPGSRNVISGNGYGLWLGRTGSARNIVQGNFIGTDVTGTLALGNSVGIGLGAGCSNNTIGGTNENARNISSGNKSVGIYLAMNNSGNVILGNFFGTDVSGREALGNTHAAIYMIRNASGNTIGGPTPGAGNTIAFTVGGLLSTGAGVFIDEGVRNAIRGNSIFGNAGLGIDFGSGKVTPNDVGDADSGPNNRQNFPVLASAVGAGNDVTIQGALQSRANAVFNIDFFHNSECSEFGYGEGKHFIGSVAVTTDANGDASFKVSFPTSLGASQVITSTATDAAGNTSQFSPCVQVTANASLPRLVVARPDASLSLVLSWPTSSPGYILETTDKLSPPAVWLAVTNPPTTAGDQNRIITKASRLSGFYRLRKP